MILVTGGTGGIGSEFLRLLSHAGVPARALTRNLKKAQILPGITWVVGDLARPETLTTAFEGCTTVFLLTHYFEDMVALQHNAIAAARVAGVTHVVKVSAFAASDHSNAPIGRWHYERVASERDRTGPPESVAEATTNSLPIWWCRPKNIARLPRQHGAFRRGL